MAKVQVIDIVDTQQPWMKLMQYFQNTSKNTVFRCKFPDRKEATKIRNRMNDVIGRNPEWFSLIIAQRDCDVYVVNVGHATEVEVRYG